MRRENAGNNSRSLTFTEHLEELRARLIICAIALVVGSIVGLFVARPVLGVLIAPLRQSIVGTPEKLLRITIDSAGNLRLAEPLREKDLEHLSRFRIEFEFQDNPAQKFLFGPDYRTNLYYFSPVDPIVLTLKVAVICGIILSLPIILWQLWLFVRPALTPSERRYIRPLIIMAFMLFPIGVAFAYYMLRFALGLFFRYAIAGLEARINVFNYLNFTLTLMIASGFIFEFPLVILFLTRIGVISTDFLRKHRGHAIVVIVVVAALLTPPDVITQIALSVPLILLYEISIWLAKPLEKKRRSAESTPQG
jgi:sec-independent protein translocase protein TatC